jgi:hypothetical protein
LIAGESPASVAKTGRHPPAYHRSSRNGEEHDRCSKAIIKTTLDIQDSSHPHRNKRVEHGGRAQAGIDRSERGGEQQRRPDSDFWERAAPD